MPKYLVEASITVEGLKGTLQEGGTARHTAVKEAVESLGGTLESFYYAFGDTDVVGIADMPSPEAMAAFAATVGASGTAAVKTTVLLTPEDVDAAAKMTPRYRPPGG